MTNLRSKLIRLAHAKPELRPALLPLLKTGSFPRVVKEVEDDYRRKAITVSEKNELLAAIEDAETEQEAKKLVADHRKGRTASSLQRSDVPEFLAKELVKIPGFKVKTSKGKLTLTVGDFNPAVKSMEITGLDKEQASLRIHLKNGLSGWSWNDLSQSFYNDKVVLYTDIIFKRRPDPEVALRDYIKNTILKGLQEITLKGALPPVDTALPPVDTAKSEEFIQAKLLQIVKSVAKDALAFKASMTNSGGPEIRIKTYPDRPRLEFEFSTGEYGQSWGWGWNLRWDAKKDQVYLSSSNPQHHVAGGHFPLNKVKAELQRRLDQDKKAYLRVVEKQREKALQEKVPEESSDQVWSVVTLGRNDGYASEVSTFKSKSDAEREAKSMGNAYVVKGTQMWNEPLGQVEEHDRPSPSRFFP